MRHFFFITCLSFCIYSQCTAIDISLSNETVPTYIDNKKDLLVPTRKVNETAAPVEFTCVVKKTASEDIVTWAYNNKTLATENLKDFEYDAKKAKCNGSICQHKLIIKNILMDNLNNRIGSYSCKYNSKVSYGTLSSAPIISFGEKQSRSGMEGDTFNQPCKVTAFPECTNITWIKKNGTLTFNDRIKMGPKNSLQFANLEKDDKGIYICTAENVIGKTENGIDIRVKDKFAALWPFIGIVIEVIVLVVIILLYEKKRASKKVPANEEEDGINPKEHLTTTTEDTDLRQRPVKT